MTSLATTADVAVELGLEDDSEWTETEQIRIGSLLTKASYVFRQAAGRQFTTNTYTHRVQVVGGRARLPESPVTAVSAVVDDSGNNVAYTRNGDWLNVSGHHDTAASFSCYRPPDLGTGWFISATYTGGGVPDIVRITVAQAVARALNVDPVAATGVRSHEQTMGPFTERKQYFDWAAETVSLTDEELSIAQSFRYPGTAPIVHRSC